MRKSLTACSGGLAGNNNVISTYMGVIKHIWSYWTDAVYRHHIDLYNRQEILNRFRNEMEENARMMNFERMHPNVFNDQEVRKAYEERHKNN